MKQQLEPSETFDPQLRWASVLESVPSLPGVYWFLDENAKVLYVGKAKDLHKRVYSYTRVGKHSLKTLNLVLEAVELKFQVLTSELEALLIEAELINAHQPHYNLLLKDDKSPLYVIVTDDEFPRVLTARKQKVFGRKGIKAVFGPFPSTGQVRYVLKLARTIFPWCNEKKKTGKACFYVHVQLCSGACAGLVTKEAYGLMIDHLCAFLRGKTIEVVQQMKIELKLASETQQYEHAAMLRDQLQMIDEVTKQKRLMPLDMKLPQLLQQESDEMMLQLRRLVAKHLSIPKNYPLSRIEGYDISNTQGTEPSASMVVATQGRMTPSEYKMFNIRLGETPNDYGMLQEALTRRQKHPEWGMPDLLMIDGGKGQLRAALSVWEWSVPVCSLAKDPDRVFFYHPETKTYTMTLLKDGDPSSTLLRRIRDEAHRFAKKQHTRLRTKAVIK